MQELAQLRLDDLALFIRVVELGTLSAAAREPDIPVSQVTRTLNRIEDNCGARLLHRTTHGLSLTDEGDTFLAYCRQVQDQMAELSSELSGKVSDPSGWVRISASALMAQAVVAPSLSGLYEKYPDLRVDINADDRMADMARDGIDIAIRSGMLSSDTMVAKQLGSIQRSLYASPSYLAKAGTPMHVNELINHHLIGNSAIPAGNRWPAILTSKLAANQCQTITDNSALVLTLTLGGLGIAQLIDLTARPLVETGRLIPVLAGHFEKISIPFYAVMLQERHRLPKIRACIDYWAEWVKKMQ
jgi:DNA-binding transcriptional LysR family regulator